MDLENIGDASIVGLARHNRTAMNGALPPKYAVWAKSTEG